MNIEVKEGPDKAMEKGNSKLSINKDRLERLKEKYNKLLKRMQAIPGLAGMFGVGMMASTHSVGIAVLGGAIALGTGMLIAKTHELVLKRQINSLEKETVKRK